MEILTYRHKSLSEMTKTELRTVINDMAETYKNRLIMLRIKVRSYAKFPGTDLPFEVDPDKEFKPCMKHHLGADSQLSSSVLLYSFSSVLLPAS